MAQAALIPSEEDLVDIASAADQLVNNIEGGSIKANLHEIFNERAKPQKEQLEHLKSEIKRENKKYPGSDKNRSTTNDRHHKR